MSAGAPASSASRTARAARSEFEPTEHLSVKEVRRADRFTQFALVSGDEALAEAGWSDELPYEADRIASILGTGIGGIGTLERGKELLIESGPKKVPPLSVPLMMSNAAAAAVSMRYKLLGPCHGIVSACSGGADAIGAAKMMIESGLVDAVVTGGSEAAITPLSLAAFGALDALSVKGISRPFDEERDGFVMGEGAGILVLEARRQGGGARREGARHAEGLRRFGRRVPPDRAGQGRRRALARDDRGAQGRRHHARGRRLRQRARHVDVAQRRRRDRRAEDGARRPRVQDPDLVAEVVDRAHCSAPPAPWRPWRRSSPCATGSRRRRSGSRTPARGSTSTTSRGSAKPLNIDGKPAIAISSSFGFGGHNAVLCLEAA